MRGAQDLRGAYLPCGVALATAQHVPGGAAEYGRMITTKDIN